MRKTCLTSHVLFPLFLWAQGWYAFDFPTNPEPESLLQNNPTIPTGRLVAEIHPWHLDPIGGFLPDKPKKS